MIFKIPSLTAMNSPFLRYFYCNCCINLCITVIDIEENVSRCFFSKHSHILVKLHTGYWLSFSIYNDLE